MENVEEQERGPFHLLTVSQQRASLFTAAYGYLHPHMDLNPSERVTPSDMDEEEYRELLSEYMEESKHIAQVVALRQAGYEVEIESEGVEVVEFVEEAPAEDYLEKGDTINRVDGKEVYLASEVPVIVQDREIGEKVPMVITREEQSIEVSIPTVPHPEDKNLPSIGVYIQTLTWEPVLPVEITMDTGNIAGPSAGLMFTLEILNQLIPEDITAGKNIAGTGKIDLDEKVGTIGGVKQKVIAAEEAGIEYFFIPEGNYDEARKAANEVAVIPVKELDDALEFLENLQEN
ncbi:MAG: S16 family serine protease [Bacillota bacterium]